MPWQRNMLQPYLSPPELPDSELLELLDYAMRFVERNDGDLLDTLLDFNDAIFREYTYVQNATTLGTTAFDVYATRRGVCQDFTNLFICLARLMGVPARYVCGYLFTGAKAANQRQAEASHAWVQVYLPEVGWRGLDPTNGVITQHQPHSPCSRPQLPRCHANVGHALSGWIGGDAGGRRDRGGRRDSLTAPVRGDRGPGLSPPRLAGSRRGRTATEGPRPAGPAAPRPRGRAATRRTCRKSRSRRRSASTAAD